MNDSDRVLTIGVVDADPIPTSNEVTIARTPADLDRRIEQLRTVSNRLVWALAVLVVIGIPAAVLDSKSLVAFPTPAAVLFVGFVGGFVGLQRRLKALTDEDLTLLANSWVCIALSPIVGAILAELVYLLFASGLLEGSMFPHFVKDANSGPTQGLQTIFAVECASAADYAKVLFWGFLAGFSEKFATNIIGQFETRGLQEKKPEVELVSREVKEKKLEIVT